MTKLYGPGYYTTLYKHRILVIEYVNNLYLVSLTTTRIIVLKIKHCLRAFLIAAKYKLILPKKASTASCFPPDMRLFYSKTK